MTGTGLRRLHRMQPMQHGVPDGHINIARGVNVMREALYEAGLAPLQLMAVAQGQAGRGNVFGVGTAELLRTVDALRAQGIVIPVDEPRADVMLVYTVIDVLLYQDALAATARILNHLGVNWTLRSTGFEAANFGLLSGSEALQKAASKRLIDKALAIGAKWSSCRSATAPTRRCVGTAGSTTAIRFLLRFWLPPNLWAGKCKTDCCNCSRAMPARHTPITMPASSPARHGGVIDEPRAAIRALGSDFRETAPTAELNWCCGGGAGTFLINRAAPLRHKAWGIKREQIRSHGRQHGRRVLCELPPKFHGSSGDGPVADAHCQPG